MPISMHTCLAYVRRCQRRFKERKVYFLRSSPEDRTHEDPKPFDPRKILSGELEYHPSMRPFQYRRELLDVGEVEHVCGLQLPRGPYSARHLLR